MKIDANIFYKSIEFEIIRKRVLQKSINTRLSF